MIYNAQLFVNDDFLVNLIEINIPKEESQNVEDALNCELFYNEALNLDF